MDWRTAQASLKTWRNEGKRCSSDVLAAWEALKSHTGSLGDESWAIYEQVANATFDCPGNEEVFKTCLSHLQKKFPDSIRVQLLKGMELESKARFDAANAFYDDLLEEHPTNAAVMKRKVAVIIGKGDIKGAVDNLNKYLKIFPSDGEAWRQLVDLYLDLQQYPQAAFCLEELLLSNPFQSVFNQKYAEVRYTMGSREDLLVARKYFAQALKLNPGNTRAMYGLYMASTSTAAGKDKAKIDEASSKLQLASAGQLKSALKASGAGTDAADMLKGMLDACSLSA